MSSSTGPLPISSILRTLAAAPQSHDKHQAARQLAALDPKRFLSNLKNFATTGSRQALSALKADMSELDDIFYKLSRAGYDVSAAQRDYCMLQQFIAQFSSSPEGHAHHRAGSFPTTPHPVYSSSQSPHSQSGPRPIQARHRSDSVVLPTPYSHPYTYSSSYSHSPPTQSHFYPHTPPKNEGYVSFPIAPSSSSSSSGSSRRSSTSSVSSHQAQIQTHPTPRQPIDIPSVSHSPNRLVKPRRMSAPVLQPMQHMQPMKKVHWATHATVYTFSTSAPALMPPSRPSCIPRGSVQAEDTRSRF